MASLGYLWLLDRLNESKVVRGERFFFGAPTLTPGREPESLESATPLRVCDLIAVSLSYELDVLNLIRILEEADIPPLACDREAEHPLVLIGGPLTRANIELLRPFGDAVVHGDGEPAMDALLESLRGGTTTKEGWLSVLKDAPGVVIGDGDPGVAHCAGAEVLPVVSPMLAPECSLGNLLLVEVSRGCPQSCHFCIGRRQNSAMRWADTDTLLSKIPEWAPGLGIIGAAVSYHPGLKEMLRFAAQRELPVGLSSLRADKADAEIMGLLARTGSSVLTIAADGPSQAVRDRIEKRITEEDLLKAAALAGEAGLKSLKLYAIYGFPGETDDDLMELASLANTMNRSLPVTLSVNVLIPKKETPLESAPFVTVKEANRRFSVLKRNLSGGVRLNAESPKEAAMQTLLSHATRDDAPKLVELAHTRASAADWRAVFGERFRTLER